jgi:GlpG protein
LREIGSINREKDARTLADYLLTLDITTKLEPKGEGWAIWVHREDRVPEARAILDDFEKDPAGPRFQSAAKTADEIRKKTEKDEKAYRKRVKSLRDRWEGSMYLRAPLAFALIVVSVAVTALMHFVPSMEFYLYFSAMFEGEKGELYDTGFDAIRHGEVWRLVTPIFLHFGIFHLFFNMVGMRYLGERIEMRKGTWRFALICLVAAIGGNVGEFFKSGGAFGGMSGVVFALAGYLWIKGHTDPEDGLSLDQRSVNWMISWFLLGIILPMTAGPETPRGFPYNMANVAHGVGLGVGMVFGLLRF